MKKSSKIKTFDELSDKFHSLFWPDGKHVITNWKDIEDAHKKFDMYLIESGWSDEEWMAELLKRIKKDLGVKKYTNEKCGEH